MYRWCCYQGLLKTLYGKTARLTNPAVFHEEATYNVLYRLDAGLLDLVQSRDYESLKGGTIISNETNKYGYHTQFTLCAPHEYIVGYEWQQTVIYKNFTVATIAAVPRDKNKNQRGCAIKLANPVLYTQGWYDLLRDIASAMRWQVHNITRVDLAADFNYFINGLYPETFIRKYTFKGGDGFIRVVEHTCKFFCSLSFFRLICSFHRYTSIK